MHKNFTIINAETGQKIDNCEMRNFVENFIGIFKKCEIFENDVIFIDLPRSFEAIFAILACLQLKIAFTFCRENENYEKFRTTLIFDGEKIRRISRNSEKIDNICYVITTSGTTGIRKQVAVPISCIQPNIDYFCTLFQLTPADAVLFSTSLSFDPSIVELFMAFQTGCSLILTPDEFRSEPHRMQTAIERWRPTVAQFTPTVFEMLPPLSAHSSLRILLLGGSHFPLELIKCSKPPKSLRIFNVYGVTEISCWASVHEVDAFCDEVSIGESIPGSELHVSEGAELIIRGSRQCFVNGKIDNELRTGDRVEQLPDGGLRIVGRMNRVIKHRGTRVCLDHLESLVLREHPDIQSVHFIHHNSRRLIQFQAAPSFSNSESPKHEKIQLSANTVVSTTVIHIARMPINSSGKVAENELLRILEKKEIEKFDDLEYILEQKLAVKLEGKVMDMSFVELGVKSMLAAELSALFGAKFEVEALRMLLDPKISIREFLERFETEKFEFGAKNIPSTTVPRDTVQVRKIRQAPLKWAVDLKKCIDGNVLVVSPSLIICAAHSGIVIAVNPSDGRLIWRTECGVRFEATPTLMNQEVVIGSKTHGLHFLSLKTGEILAKIDNFGVRARVLYDGNSLYCTSEDGVFYAIDPKTRLPTFHHQIARGATSVGPVISPTGSIYATLTSGHVARITVATKSVQWCRNYGPIFAEPSFIGSSPVILNVHGVLRILNEDTGETTNQITLVGEQCFCAPLIIEQQQKFLIATKSGKLVIIDFSVGNLKFHKIIDFSIPASFVRTPRLVHRNQSVYLTLVSIYGCWISGRLQDADLKEVIGMPISAGKEVFTAPETLGNLLLIAGRDDYLSAFSDFSYQ